MKPMVTLSAAILALLQFPTHADILHAAERNHSANAPAEVVDNVGAEVRLWFPDVPGDAEYVVHTIADVTFMAGVYLSMV